MYMRGPMYQRKWYACASVLILNSLIHVSRSRWSGPDEIIHRKEAIRERIRQSGIREAAEVFWGKLLRTARSLPLGNLENLQMEFTMARRAFEISSVRGVSMEVGPFAGLVTGNAAASGETSDRARARLFSLEPSLSDRLRPPTGESLLQDGQSLRGNLNPKPDRTSLS